MSKRTGARQDPCVLDTVIAAVRFMEGAPKRPWWHYTAERKRTMSNRRLVSFPACHLSPPIARAD